MNEENILPIYKECKCMKRLRKTDTKIYDQAGKDLFFTPSIFVLNHKYAEGIANYPVRRVFYYKDIMGIWVEQECRCYDLFGWETKVPTYLQRGIRQMLHYHHLHMNNRLCRCGQSLLASLKNKQSPKTHFCRIVNVYPPRYIYRVDGMIESVLCECFNRIQNMDRVEEDTDSEDSGDSDTEDEHEK